MKKGALMTLKEARDYSGKEESTLRRAAIRGTLKAEKMGRDWLVTKEALDAYLAVAATRRPDLRRTEPPDA